MARSESATALLNTLGLLRSARPLVKTPYRSGEGHYRVRPLTQKQSINLIQNGARWNAKTLSRLSVSRFEDAVNAILRNPALYAKTKTNKTEPTLEES